MLSYVLKRKKGMKNIRIKITSEGEVAVSAPYYVSKSRIDSFVAENEEWIRKNIALAAEKKDKPLCDGTAITFLGERLTLEFIQGEEGYCLKGDRLILSLPDIDEEAKRKEALIRFYGEEGKKTIPPIVEKYLKNSDYKGSIPKLSLKLMKSQWGSCNRKSGRITFNLLLMKLPLKYLEYTAAHEVTHLFIKGHGEEFYAFGERLFQNFYITDRELNKIKNTGLFD